MGRPDSIRPGPPFTAPEDTVPTEPGATSAPTDVLIGGVAAAARADLDVALAAILGTAAEAVGAELGAVFLREPDGTGLELVAAIGLPADGHDAFSAAVASEPDHPIARASASVTPAFGRPGRPGGGPGETAADLPLVVSRAGLDVVLGVATFGWAGQHEIGDAEARWLVAVADVIAVTVDRAQLGSLLQERSEWLERLAHTDPLTGLANARTLGRVLELELARAARQGGDVTVAVFDVDDLQGLNERAGRETGDDILRRVAEVIGGSVRLVDTVARTGPDEFVIVAPGSAGAVVAQRVVDQISADGAGVPPFTLSAGVARFPADGTTGEAILDAAHEALASARAAGGGRLSTSG